jgi:hypothetical protein
MKTLKGETLPIPPNTPDELSQMMKNCWKLQPEDRPSFQTLYDQLLTYEQDLRSVEVLESA